MAKGKKEEAQAEQSPQALEYEQDETITQIIDRSGLSFDNDGFSFDLAKPLTRLNATRLTVRNPKAGDLRGVNMLEFAKADTDTMFKVLPRITSPRLTEYDIIELDLGDLYKIHLGLNYTVGKN